MRVGAAEQKSRTSSLDLQRFRDAPLVREPFEHVVLRGFVPKDVCPVLEAAFPRIEKGGSFPASSLACPPAFAAFLDELQSPPVTAAFAEKFGIDLHGRPTMVTLRGQSRAKDGRIHADSSSKLITALIYLNGEWQAEGGRLRLLRGADDLEDFMAEVPPDAGTLVAFRCTSRAYHGHTSFVGQRRSIQLNWLTDEAVLRRELARHSLSAWTKRLFRGNSAAS